MAAAACGPNGAAAALLRRSFPRFHFSIAPLQSFSPTNPQFHPPGADCGAKRPWQGMDMRKINTPKYISPNIKRVPMTSGYQYLNFTTPSIYAPTQADIAVFFDTENCFKVYTPKQLLLAAWPQLRFLLMSLLAVAFPSIPILLFVLYMNRFEPMEQVMDRDEYWRHFKWHYFGPDLDHHAYTQYLEARRAKKWRGVDVNPEDYIPPQYRNL
ncbi:hypothetical protein, conserved [Eimeria tenella]|uniref:Transmembrane protein n=1 Tax=Eimeria tenella TaxID=5802 RepID=U6KT85_EIMTE|nr:hypothetical protein, conserved [Eimeria tenella]CDJ39579.1 hypothetical protein, conserved [Eimeria tenella]|eukprot:XP_013230334.1 hypothetical protein, conserved [Eimeria tenella]